MRPSMIRVVEVSLLLFGLLGLGQRSSNQFDLSKHSVPLDQIVDGGPGKDGIPALLTPQFVSVPEAAFLLEAIASWDSHWEPKPRPTPSRFSIGTKS